MAEPRTTPGLWRKLPGKHPNHFVIVAGDYADEGEPDLYIEVVTSNPADADLIAAVPDLYRSLDELVDYTRFLAVDCLGESDRDADTDLRPYTQALRKARGEGA